MTKELTMFYMDGCPYCRQAEKAIEELKRSNIAYQNVTINHINENRSPEIADQYDYYYVPTFFLRKEKLYEARPGESYTECKANVKNCFERALQG